jgi:Flp pilus assembly protein CpaB
MLSSQGTEEQAPAIPFRDVVVATGIIDARSTIGATQVTTVLAPVDVTNETAFNDTDLVVGKIAAIPIFENQPITPNMLAQSTGVGQVDILEQGETIEFDSPAWRAVSLTVPPDRAVGGLIAVDQRVDVIATMPFDVAPPVDPETGEQLTGPGGEPLLFKTGQSTKPMWLDVKVIGRPENSPELYIMRMDLQQAEEVALAQSVGAQFALALRPDVDTRDIDRSFYGETQDRVLTRYNFPIPETIDGVDYPQPAPYPSPFPSEEYLEEPEPSPTPESALVEIDEVGQVEESPAPVETIAP